MQYWYLWLTPLAVAAIVSLFCFVGCELIFKLEDTTAVDFTKYGEEVLSDAPVMYLRLQERSPVTTIPGGTAADETGVNNGTYERLGTALADDPATLSPASGQPLLEIGIAPALLPDGSLTTAVRVRGGRVRVPFATAINPPQFSIEILVEPEWDLNALGRYYAVFESTDKPATGSTNSKQRGFGLYAGPSSPADPQTPYRWQLWVGSGSDFRQLAEQPPANAGNPGPLVEAAPTFLCATFDGSEFALFAYSAGRDFDSVKYRLVAQPYVPNINADLTIGMTQGSRSLVAPFPGPDRNMYPFAGKLQEAVIFNTALKEERIVSHMMAGFIG